MFSNFLWNLTNSIGSFFVDPSGHILPQSSSARPKVDIGDILGHQDAKLGLLIAAYGRHNILFTGPPGEGKSLLAEALSGILPPLDKETVNELDFIYSNANLSWGGIDPPFIAVSPSITKSALIGGGHTPSPGAVSLAHGGVLFIDELPELPKSLIEALRIPLQSNSITVQRGKVLRIYPCDFQLCSAMNPCPCGYGTIEHCICTANELKRFKKKLSGPIMDRMDMLIHIGKIIDPFSLPQESNESEDFRKKIVLAREFRLTRKDGDIRPPSYLSLRQCIYPDSKSMRWAIGGYNQFKGIVVKKRLSLRKASKIAQVARSIADLHLVECVHRSHIDLATQYIGVEYSGSEKEVSSKETFDWSSLV